MNYKSSQPLKVKKLWGGGDLDDKLHLLQAEWGGVRALPKAILAVSCYPPAGSAALGKMLGSATG